MKFTNYLLGKQVSNCFGGVQGTYFCCTEKLPCGVGEGSCIFDQHCEPGLICGYKNCDPKLFPSDANCCAGILYITDIWIFFN